jgi:hypothetical protein
MIDVMNREGFPSFTTFEHMQLPHLRSLQLPSYALTTFRPLLETLQTSSICLTCAACPLESLTDLNPSLRQQTLVLLNGLQNAQFAFPVSSSLEAIALTGMLMGSIPQLQPRWYVGRRREIVTAFPQYLLAEDYCTWPSEDE